MRPAERLLVASAAATMLGALTMMPITQDRSYLGWSLVLVLLLGAAGAVARRTPARDLGALAGQLIVLPVVLLLLALGLRGPEQAEYGLLDSLGWLSTSAVEHLRSQAAPMERQPGVLWLMVAGAGLAMVMTDLLVCTLQRHVWGIAPSLTLFLIPALSLRADLGISGGVAIVLGYLGILLAEGINRTERWRRGVTDDPHHRPRSVAPVLWGSAALVTVPALVLAMIAWLAIPTGNLGLLGGGRGSGSGGPLQLGDPTLDLRRNLTRPDDVTILSYTTSGGSSGDADDGVYLRLASLPRFDANGWQNTAIQVLDGQPGSIPGVGSEPPRRRTTNVTIGSFDSEYLPLPYAPRQVDAPGEWGYDPQSLVYIATGDDRNQATRGIEYSVQSADLVPDGDVLSNARPGSPDDYAETGPTPDDLPDEIVDLAFEITGEADTPALKAAAIQSYLRSGEFQYSTVPAPGTGYDALTNFLFKDKRGYCEQYAGAMAALARVVGIPSRVAIGFLPGEKVGDRWEVSTHDLHAWPELYFEGLGWVRWEPTPGNGASPPPWTVARAGGSEETTAASSSATGEESEVSTGPTSEASGPSEEPSAGAGTTTEDEQSGWGPGAWVAIGLGVLVLVGLMALPGLVRERRRRVHLSTDRAPGVRVEGAWQEVRDTVLDHRGTWPSGSPRAIGQQLARGMDSAEAGEVGRLALLVERARYSRGLDDQDDAAGMERLTDRVRTAVIGPASQSQRIRARLWPRSLWHGGSLREALRRPRRSGRRGL